MPCFSLNYVVLVVLCPLPSIEDLKEKYKSNGRPLSTVVVGGLKVNFKGVNFKPDTRALQISCYRITATWWNFMKLVLNRYNPVVFMHVKFH